MGNILLKIVSLLMAVLYFILKPSYLIVLGVFVPVVGILIFEHFKEKKLNYTNFSDYNSVLFSILFGVAGLCFHFSVERYIIVIGAVAFVVFIFSQLNKALR